MEIRDVIHGSIVIDKDELPVIDSRFFQRLRHILQLGFAEHSFPGATHNRYTHSLGAMAAATHAFDTIFRGPHSKSDPGIPGRLPLPDMAPKAFGRFRAAIRLAALLHDIGHGPLSHTTEAAMPDASKLWPDGGARHDKRRATHEDYTLKIILDSPLTPLIENAGAPYGMRATHVAALIDKFTPSGDDFFIEHIEGARTDFRPLLGQLISSELDADRMDYLRRDSLHAGVSYGEFDFDWITANLTSHIKDGRCFLSLQHRALYSFEDFLISRFHMFLMVYFHYKSVIFDSMLMKYLASPDCGYRLPADIEQYCDCTDTQLYSHLLGSKNEWAMRTSGKRPYKMLVELHSGIPATKTAADEQKHLLEGLRRELDSRAIPYLSATSTGQLSKYFSRPGDPIFVRYDNHYSEPEHFPLEKCTDLFERYSEKRHIERLYVAPEHLGACQNLGKGLHVRLE